MLSHRPNFPPHPPPEAADKPSLTGDVGARFAPGLILQGVQVELVGRYAVDGADPIELIHRKVALSLWKPARYEGQVRKR